MKPLHLKQILMLTIDDQTTLYYVAVYERQAQDRPFFINKV